MLKFGFIFFGLSFFVTPAFSQTCSSAELANAQRIRADITRLCGLQQPPAECSTAPQNVRLATYEVTWVLYQGNRIAPHCRAKDCFGNYNPGFDWTFYGSVDYPASCDPYFNVVEIPEIDVAQSATNNGNPRVTCGSVIYNSNQVVGETIPLTGVPFYLTHFSNSVQGRIGDYTTKFVVASTAISPLITGTTVIAKDELGNILDSKTYNANPNQVHTYTWNGLNLAGNLQWGSKNHKIIYKVSTSGNSIADKEYLINLGNFKAIKLGLGGWVPSIWRFYDNDAEKVYNGDGSVRKIKAAIEGNLKRVASSDGSEVYYFDQLGRIVYTKTGLTGALLYSFQYRTDETLASITDVFGKVTRFNYDINGKVVEVVSAENVRIKLTTNSNGYLASVTNPKNEIYNMTYKDANGLLATYKKPNANLTTFTYDIEGNLLVDLNSAGHSSTLAKTEAGVRTTSSMGRILQNKYNKNTETEVEIRPSGLTGTYKFSTLEDTVTLPYSTAKTTYVEDTRFGLQVRSPSKLESTNFGSTLTTIENEVNLNDLANPFAINSISKTITQGDSELTSQYDGLTRTSTLTSKLGRSIATQLDSLERPILEKVGTLVPTKYKYDQDRITEVAQGDRKYNFTYNAQTKLLQSVKNSENETVSFGYDEAQRLKSKTLPDGRVINYIYDSNGNLTSLTPPSRPAHKQVYGANEKLASYNPPALTGVASVNTTYAYNLDKQLTKIARPDGAEINYNYNPITGLLDSIVGAFGTLSNLYSNERLIKITDNTGRTMNFAYTGNVVSAMSLRNASSKTEYAYQRTPLANSNGLIKSETLFVGTKTQTINYGFDDDKFLVKAGDLDLAYNTPNGNLKETALQNVKEEYTYNTYGEIAGYKAYYLEGSEKKLLYSYDLKRDKVGRIVKKSESFGKDEEKRHKHHHHRHYCRHHNHDDKIDTEYDYDKAGRLTRVKAEKRADSIYLYDHNSNRIAGVATGEPFLAVYDNQDRLIRYNNQTYTYNANGDLLSKAEKVKKAYVTTNYNYDAFGSLKLAGNVTYKTDQLQRRALKLVNNVVVKQYAYTPEGKLIGEMDGDGNLLKTFIYGSKGHVPDYFIDQNNELFKLVLDHLGSVRLIVKAATGEIVQKMNHDEFGKVLEDSNPGFVPFGFAGGIYDSETGLVRFGLRDFDSETGRWTSKDLIRFAAGDVNLYGYVMQDPVNFIDSTGLTAEDISKMIEYVSNSTGMPRASFAVGTPSGSSGFALPPFNFILLEDKYGGNLTYDQQMQLMRTVYHELRHLQDGVFKSLFSENGQHEKIGIDAENFMNKNWRFAKQRACGSK